MKKPNATVPHRPAFVKEEHLMRIEKIQYSMRQEDINAIVVRDISNFYYVTGMDQVAEHDFFCAVVPQSGEPFVYLNEFQRVLYEHAAGHFEPIYYSEHEDKHKKLLDVIYDRVGKNATLKGDSAAVAELANVIRNTSGSALQILTQIIEHIRMVKSENELCMMQKAALHTECGVQAALQAAYEGAQDRDLASAAIVAMLKNGSDFPPLAPVIAAGYRGGIPYSTFDDAILGRGSSVFVELTGVERGYVAPLMRTAVVGEASVEIERAARAAQKAVESICEVARPGRNSQEVLEAAMRELAPELDGILFHHIIAYPVGIAFPPAWVEQVLPGTIKKGNEFPLKKGMTFHLPMSLRKEGKWAVGLSQTIHIGAAETVPITQSEAELFRVAA